MDSMFELTIVDIEEVKVTRIKEVKMDSMFKAIVTIVEVKVTRCKEVLKMDSIFKSAIVSNIVSKDWMYKSV